MDRRAALPVAISIELLEQHQENDQTGWVGHDLPAEHDDALVGLRPALQLA